MNRRMAMRRAQVPPASGFRADGREKKTGAQPGVLPPQLVGELGKPQLYVCAHPTPNPPRSRPPAPPICAGGASHAGHSPGARPPAESPRRF